MSYSPMQLAEAFIKTGELPDALDALNQQLAAKPDDNNARRLRARVLLLLRDESGLNQAIEDLQALAQHTADDWVQLSITYERLKRIDDAVQAMQQALHFEPESERNIERLIGLMAAQQDYDSALKLVRQQTQHWRWLQIEGDILAQSGDDMMATARYGLAIAQLEDRFDLEREDYLRAIKGRLLLARAHAYRQSGHYQLADEHYLAAQAIASEDKTINFYRGLLQAAQGNFEQAVALCRGALEQSSAFIRAELLNELQKNVELKPLYDQLR